MRKILKQILKVLSKTVIRKYNPIVIGITGSVGKTSTKEAVFAVLKSKYSVRRSRGNLNNEFGIPLTIFGDFYEDYFDSGGFLFWLGAIFKGLRILIKKVKYPEILILELAADKPGDIEYLVNLVKPKIGVMTAIGEMPVHVEFFSGPEHIAEEKSKLISALPNDGFAILNFDDEIVFDMSEKSKAQIVTFGIDSRANINISNFDFTLENQKPLGISFKLTYNGNLVPIRLHNTLGKSQAYAAAAAAALGVALNMNLVEISQSLTEYQSPPGRLKLLKGIRNSLIIDDTYNSSSLSTHTALDTVRALPAKRRIAILGDMLELGQFSEQAHRQAGNLAGELVEYLFTVGRLSKFTYDSAFNQLPKDNIESFNGIKEAREFIKNFIQEGDLILVKGSQSVRMEKIVEEIMAEPEKKKELLVRQNPRWLKRKPLYP